MIINRMASSVGHPHGHGVGVVAGAPAAALDGEGVAVEVGVRDSVEVGEPCEGGVGVSA